MSNEARAPILVVPKLSGGLNKLTLGQIWFAAWCALPEWERDPWSKTDLARRLGVSRATLYAWWRNKDVVEAIRTLGRRFGERDYGRVVGAVVREAVKGSVAHARLYFELMGDLGQEAIESAFRRGETSVQNVQVQVLGDPTFDQRRLEISDDLANKIAAARDGEGAGSS